jgi:hypothetical protein
VLLLRVMVACYRANSWLYPQCFLEGDQVTYNLMTFRNPKGQRRFHKSLPFDFIRVTSAQSSS